MQRLLITLFLGLFSISTINAQPPKDYQQLTRILFVFDGSQSMYGIWNKEQKITIARKVMIEMVDSLKNIPNIELALRVYGHQSPVPPQDCNDTKLEVPFSPDNANMIKQKLHSIDPKGTTPIARSLELAARDFPVEDNVRNIIILITDGIEACDGDPCAVSKELQKRGVMLRPFIIGLGYDIDFTETFKCVGRVFNAKDETQFKDILSVAVSEALNSTTAQVNLLDKSGKPTETNVNMTFYDDFSGQIKYNYIHTINDRGNPDTLILDPLVKYNLVVHTLPPVKKNDIEISPGKHTTISLDAPQGYLELKKPGGLGYNNLQFIVKKANNYKTLNVQTVGAKEKYICGKYDIEILCLPRIQLKNIEVNQSSTTTLRIRPAGQISLLKNTPGYGAVYVIRDNKMELVVNLDPENSSAESFFLQPGKYKVIFRPKNSSSTLDTFEKSFNIESGENVHIKLY